MNTTDIVTCSDLQSKVNVLLKQKFNAVLKKIHREKLELQSRPQLNKPVTIMTVKNLDEYGTITPLTTEAVDALTDMWYFSSHDLYVESGSNLSLSSSEIPHCIVLDHSQITIDKDSKVDNVIFDHFSNIQCKNNCLLNSYLSNVNLGKNVTIKNSALNGSIDMEFIPNKYGHIPYKRDNCKQICYLEIQTNSSISDSFIRLNNMFIVTSLEKLLSYCNFNKLIIDNSTLEHAVIDYNSRELINEQKANNDPVESRIIDSHIKDCVSCYLLNIENVTLKPDKTNNGFSGKCLIIDNLNVLTSNEKL